MATIVVNCSKRKRMTPNLRLSARDLARGTLEEVSRQWNERVASSTQLTKAEDLMAVGSLEKPRGRTNSWQRNCSSYPRDSASYSLAT